MSDGTAQVLIVAEKALSIRGDVSETKRVLCGSRLDHEHGGLCAPRHPACYDRRASRSMTLPRFCRHLNNPGSRFRAEVCDDIEAQRIPVRGRALADAAAV